MVIPFLQGGKAATQAASGYWSSGAESADEQRKKYRNQPVPAILAQGEKHIDKRVELEILSEVLAGRNQFTEKYPNLGGLSLEQVMPLWNDFVEKVINAPPEQKEDAQRSLGGHLKGFGATIGRGLLSGVSTIMGLPGVMKTMEAISAPGEEAAAQIIYGVARILPGTQDIERGINEWRDENRDAPWWKRATLTAAVRDKGFGVPMGVHLPMEIIFDPLNLLPVGWGIKAIKTATIAAKFTGRGYDFATAVRYAQRAQRAARSAQVREDKMWRELLKNEDLADEMDEAVKAGVVREVDEAGNVIEREVAGNMYDDLDPDMVDVARGKGIDPEMAFDPRDPGGLGGRPRPAAARGYSELDTPGDAADKLTGKKPRAKKYWQKLYSNFLNPEEAQTYDINNLPGIRGRPDRESLKRLIDDLAIQPIQGQYRESDKLYWALQALYHTGLRPHELPYIHWQDVEQMLQSTAKKRWLTISYTVGKKTHAVQRLLDQEAIEFFQFYKQFRESPAVIAGARKPFDETAAFTLPNPVKKDAGNIVSGLNEQFFDLASKPEHADYGPKLLEFFSPDTSNGYYSYVFRLSKGNEVWRRAGNLEDVMHTLGHTSPQHTSVYISLGNHSFNTGIRNLLNDLPGRRASKPTKNALGETSDQGKDAAEIANKEINEGAWIDDLSEEELELFKGFGKRYGNKETGQLDVWSRIPKGKATQKGFLDSAKVKANAAIEEQRVNLLRKLLDPEAKGVIPYILPPGGYGPAGSKKSLTGAISSLMGLQHLALNITEAITEKNLIATSKEVANYGTTKADAFHTAKENQKFFQDLGKAARSGSAQLQGWFGAILRLKDEFIDEINAVTTAIPLAATRTPTSVVVKDIVQKFELLTYVEMSKIINASKGGGGAARFIPRKLTDAPLFKSLHLMQQKTPVKQQTTGPAKAAQDAFKALSQDVKDELSNLAVGYIVHPLKAGMKTLVDAAGKSVKGDNPYWRETDSGQDLWMVTDWVKWDGMSYRYGDDVLEIGKVQLEKLGSNPFQGGMIVKPRVEKTIEVSLLDFEAWALQIDTPFPKHLVQGASSGGFTGLSAVEIVEALMKFGGDAKSDQTMAKMKEATQTSAQYLLLLQM